MSKGLTPGTLSSPELTQLQPLHNMHSICNELHNGRLPARARRALLGAFVLRKGSVV